MSLCRLLAFIFILVLPLSSNARSAPDSFADLVEGLLPMVVNVSTSQTLSENYNPFEGFFPYGVEPDDSLGGNLPELFEKFYGNKNPVKRKAMSLGSGFIISQDGVIVTNYHVIADADEVTVTFSDDTKVKAKVIGKDPKTDLAILKVDVDKKLPFVKWGDSSKARVGDWVIAIGNPFGLGVSVSAGIISARARDINSGPFDDFIQTDAAINRGNSGGPLFNSKGEIIGINSVIFTPSGGNVGIGFAVPSALATPVIDQLRDHGRTQRGWLGVKIQMVTEEIADSLQLQGKPRGALVLAVTKDSPAEKAGIMSGDIVLSFDGKDIPLMRKLPRIVADTQIGKDVALSVWRNGEEKKMNVKIAELDEGYNKTAQAEKEDVDEGSDFKDSSKMLGMEVVKISRALRKQYDIDDKAKGLLVVDVDEDSQAYEKSIQPGFVITSINQEEVTDISQAKVIIDKVAKMGRKSVLLMVSKSGESMYVALPIDGKN